MRNVVITGSASGIGLATRNLLESQGDRVVGVDVRDAEIVPCIDRKALDVAHDVVGEVPYGAPPESGELLDVGGYPFTDPGVEVGERVLRVDLGPPRVRGPPAHRPSW